MKSKSRVFIPLAFMVLGLIFMFWNQREFQHRADRDNAELRQDLKEAGVSSAELAVLMSAQTKLQANTSSYTHSAAFIVLLVTIFSAIPLYARIDSEEKSLGG